MEMVLTYLEMEIYTQDITFMVNLMVKESISGRMEVCTLGILRMASSMEKESGERVMVLIAIITKAIMTWIRSMAMGYFNGQVVISIKEIIKMMIVTGMVK